MEENIIAIKTHKYRVLCSIIVAIIYAAIIYFSICNRNLFFHLFNKFDNIYIHWLLWLAVSAFILLAVPFIIIGVREDNRKDIVATYTDKELILEDETRIPFSEITKIKMHAAPFFSFCFKYTFGSIIIFTSTQKYKIKRICNIQETYEKLLKLTNNNSLNDDSNILAEKTDKYGVLLSMISGVFTFLSLYWLIQFIIKLIYDKFNVSDFLIWLVLLFVAIVFAFFSALEFKRKEIIATYTEDEININNDKIPFEDITKIKFYQAPFLSINFKYSFGHITIVTNNKKYRLSRIENVHSTYNRLLKLTGWNQPNDSEVVLMKKTDVYQLLCSYIVAICHIISLGYFVYTIVFMLLGGINPLLFLKIIIPVVTAVPFVLLGTYEMKRNNIVATYTKTELIINNQLHIPLTDIADIKIREAPFFLFHVKYTFGDITIITNSSKYRITRIANVQNVYGILLKLLNKEINTNNKKSNILAGKTNKYIIRCIIGIIILTPGLFIFFFGVFGQLISRAFDLDFIFLLSIWLIHLLPVTFFILFSIHEHKRNQIIAEYTDKEIIINENVRVKIKDITKIKIRKAPFLSINLKYSFGSLILITKRQKYKIARIDDADSVYNKIMELKESKALTK